MPIDLDPRFTFDSFVVGPANRLAAAAAKRVSEAPGTTYNPLFIYSGSGLGKTHLLSAIGHRVARVHGLRVRFDTVEQLMEEISTAVEAGERDAFRGRLRDVGVLLLDDVQFLAGQRQTQEELIRAWDALSSRGGQVVLSSDRAPQDIDGLDDRLLSRLSGGLIVDMGAPDFETRVAIARRKAEERGQALSPEVCHAVARVAFTNVRELQGALNRLIAVQELEGRTVAADEVPSLLGAAAADRGSDEFGEFLSEITGTVSAVVDDADRQLADAILAWEGEGFRTRRLDGALAATLPAAQAAELVRRYERDVERLRQIEAEIRAIDPRARELGRADLLRDPDRVAEAEALLAAVRDRQKPPPGPPAGPALDTFPLDSLATRAALAVVSDPGGAYNPLYLLEGGGAGKSELLAAIGNELVARRPGAVVAFLDGSAFTAELIEALELNRVEAWRARYRRADALLLDGVEALGATEGAQDELFHLFEELQRSGKQLVFAARLAPHELDLPSRLRSRLEGGLVVEFDGGPRGADAVGAPKAEGAEGAEPGRSAAASATGSPAGAGSPAEAASAGGVAASSAHGNGTRSEAERRLEHWILSPEKVLWEWPYPEEWLVEPLD